MKLQKYKPLLRGVAATAAALLTLSTVAYGVAKSDLAIGWVDGFFGVTAVLSTRKRRKLFPAIQYPVQRKDIRTLKVKNMIPNMLLRKPMPQRSGIMP